MVTLKDPIHTRVSIYYNTLDFNFVKRDKLRGTSRSLGNGCPAMLGELQHEDFDQNTLPSVHCHSLQQLQLA